MKLRTRFHDTSYNKLSAAADRLTRFFTKGWYIRGDEMSEDRKRLVLCNYTSNIIANLIGGSFLTGLLLHLQATDGFIGTISMIGTATNTLQFFAPLLLERFQKRRKTLTLFRAAMYFLNVLFIGLIPLFPIGQQGRLALIAASVLVVNMIGAFIGPGISIWHMQSVPNNVRPNYFALITMTVGSIVALFNLLGGMLVDLFRDSGIIFQGLLIVRAAALVLCAYEIYLYFHIKEYPYEENSKARFTLQDLLVKPFREKLYLMTVLVTFLWNFSANTPGAFYQVYLLGDLNVSYRYIMLMGCINVPVLFLLTPLWRKVLTRLGWIKTLYVAMSFYLCHYVLLSLVTKQTMYFYPIALVLAFSAAVGITLSFGGIPYINIPEKNKTASIGFYSTSANLAAFLGVTTGKYFILSTGGKTFNLFGTEMVNKQYLMLLTALLMTAAVVFIALINRYLKRHKAESGIGPALE